MTATVGGPGAASFSVNVRPASGDAPSTRNVFGVTRAAPMRTGSPSPVRFMLATCHEATSASVVVRVR